MQPWQRTYWVVFAANLITAIGMMSFLPFFPSFLGEMGLSDRDEIALWTGLVFGAAPLSAAFMGPIWGSIGDRFGRKAMVLRAMLAISFFVGAMCFAQTPAQLLALRIGQGLFSGFVPPSITLVSIAAPRDVQGRIAGSLQAALAAGSIIGPIVGALIQESLGMRAVFGGVCAASALGALLVALFASEDAGLRATLEGLSPTSLLRGAWQDLRALFSNPRVVHAIWLLFFVQFGLGAIRPLLELYIADLSGFLSYSVTERTAFLFTALAVAVLVATPLWGRVGDRFGHATVLVVSAAGASLALFLHAAMPFYLGLFTAHLLLGLCAAGTNASAFGMAAIETATERRGSAFGAVFSARALAVSLGAISGGGIVSWLGMRGLFLAAGGTILGAVLWTRVRQR